MWSNKIMQDKSESQSIASFSQLPRIVSNNTGGIIYNILTGLTIINLILAYNYWLITIILNTVHAGAYEEKHLAYLMSKLKVHASQWRIIGCFLGFSRGQLKNIESTPTLIPTGPVSFLQELLGKWLEQGNATLQALKLALNEADLGALSHELIIPPWNIYTKK